MSQQNTRFVVIHLDRQPVTLESFDGRQSIAKFHHASGLPTRDDVEFVRLYTKPSDDGESGDAA